MSTPTSLASSISIQSELEIKLHSCFHLLCEAATSHRGMIPSMLDRQSGLMLMHIPGPVEGQRIYDRSYYGSNLMHDHPLLAAMHAYAQRKGDVKIERGVEKYLQTFAKVCTHSASGLFPWGEHSYWHLLNDHAGCSWMYSKDTSSDMPSYSPNVPHDHLRQAPRWLWEELTRFNPACLDRFCSGLNNHWFSDAKDQYSRHAPIERIDFSKDRGKNTSCDFPRHSGFYILDLCMGFVQTGKRDHLDQARAFHDYWWTRRDEKNLLGLASDIGEGHSHHGLKSPGQTLSLSVSLLESADIIEETEPEFAEIMRRSAKVYFTAFSGAQHDFKAGLVLLNEHAFDPALSHLAPIWGSVYGHIPASSLGLLCLRYHELTGEMMALEIAKKIGQNYVELDVDFERNCPATDPGLALEFLCDLAQRTREQKFLEKANHLCARILEHFFDKPLPRGASGVDWYESQLGTGYLLHALTRFWFLEMGKAEEMAADYTFR